MPAHLEVAGLIRAVAAAGGFAAVLHKGDRDAGSILVVLTEKGGPARLFEPIPHPAGHRIWTCTRRQDAENSDDFNQYLARRQSSDPDLWIVELDVADGERFIGQTGFAA
ncbi:MAG: DUF1491 family protein [Novosphingobium sp.]